MIAITLKAGMRPNQRLHATSAARPRVSLLRWTAEVLNLKNVRSLLNIILLGCLPVQAGMPAPNPCAGKGTVASSQLWSHRDDTPMLIGGCVNGELDGVVSTFWENGKKSSEGTYKAGIRDGQLLQWYENGVLKEQDIYVHGTYRKVWIWHETGKKSAYGEYDKNGRILYWVSWDTFGKKEKEIGSPKLQDVFRDAVQPAAAPGASRR